eukprot:11557064-Alexandrium_andersonii.AAC.1
MLGAACSLAPWRPTAAQPGLGHVDLAGHAAAVTLRGLDVQLAPIPGHQEPHFGGSSRAQSAHG